MNHVIGTVSIGSRLAVLNGLRGYSARVLRTGAPAADFPASAHFGMDKSFQRNTVIAGFLYNDDGLIVVEDKVRAMLDDASPGLEFLPVRIDDSQGHARRESCFVVNTPLVACIDEERSSLTRNRKDASVFTSVESLVLDDSRIDASLGVFRLQGFPRLPIFRRDLADSLTAAGVQGIRFSEISDRGSK